jgi:hypothetical protein
MKAGYTIRERGLSKFTTIIVYNWQAMNQVDMVKWDNESFTATENVVAIFRVTPKAN